MMMAVFVCEEGDVDIGWCINLPIDFDKMEDTVGRWSYSHRTTTESKLAISISGLNQSNMLEPGRYDLQWKTNGEKIAAVRLTVTSYRTILVSYRLTGCHDSLFQDVSIPVSLTSTPCYLGGERIWFLCPDCNRRVGVLYVDGHQVSCRHCLRLTYSCQREQPFDRAIRRKQKLNTRLGVKLHGSCLIPIKKKGRHWRTHDTLLWRLKRADRTLDQQIAKMTLR